MGECEKLKMREFVNGGMRDKNGCMFEWVGGCFVPLALFFVYFSGRIFVSDALSNLQKDFYSAKIC